MVALYALMAWGLGVAVHAALPHSYHVANFGLEGPLVGLESPFAPTISIREGVQQMMTGHPHWVDTRILHRLLAFSSPAIVMAHTNWTALLKMTFTSALSKI